MNRFERGEKVWMGRGEYARQMTVALVHKNPLVPMYQYGFEAPHDGFLCGEQSLREDQFDEDLKLSDCIIEDKEVQTRINTIASGKRTIVEFGDVVGAFKDCDLRFRPSLEMCEWLRDYANGRLIIHVGSGQGHLVNMLKFHTKAKAMGLEPNFNIEKFMEWRATQGMLMMSGNEIMPWTIQRAKKLITDLGAEKTILIFTRPKVRDFVEEGIANMPEGMEALYINLAENTEEMATDLGEFADRAKVLSHKGVSEDNEVILSIIR